MRIDQNTAQGQALQKVVQTQLKGYLGSDYADDVLPLYIVVMLAHGNDQSQVAENLDAFLGAEDAGKFATWLFQHLAEHGGQYSAQDPKPAAKVAKTAASRDGEIGPAEDAVERHAEEPEAQQKSDGHRERERHRQAIEWKSEGAVRQRSERPQREEKRHRDEPRSERHGTQREPNVEAGREEKRARRSLRELKPLDAPHSERRWEREKEREPHRSRHEDGGRHHGERERAPDWERQARRGSERERDWEREAAWERERAARARPPPEPRDFRERERGMYMDRERDWEVQREREMRRLPRDGPGYEAGRGHAPPHQEPDWRKREREPLPARVEENGTHHNDVTEQSPAAEDKDNGTIRGADGRGSALTDRGDNAAGRSTVFDRLGQIRERALDESAAARKSVFDRLRGNKRPAAQERVDPEAETDEEVNALPGQAAQQHPRALPRLPAGSLATKALTGIRALPVQDKKTEDLADMKRKMAELQAQVQRLEREASSGGVKGLNPSALAFQPGTMAPAPATPALHALAGLGLPGPAVDPRSVHVQGVSPLAVPEVIGAHFSGCGLVTNVTIARDIQGVPRGFCHVEFSNELEAQIALSLSGSILMSQPIMVTPKMLRPALPMTPGGGFARARGGFSPGFSGSRGAPFSPPGAAGRGRGRMDRPLSSHKYVRPEFKAQLDRQKAGIGAAAP